MTRIAWTVAIAVLFFAPLAYFGELGAWTFDEPVSNLDWDEGMRPQQADAEPAGSGGSGSGSGGSGPSGSAGDESTSTRPKNNQTGSSGSGDSGGGSDGGPGTATSGGSGGSIGSGSSGSTGDTEPNAAQDDTNATVGFNGGSGTGGFTPTFPNFAAGVAILAATMVLLGAAFGKAMLAFFLAFAQLVWAIAWMAFFIVAMIGYIWLGAWLGVVSALFFAVSFLLFKAGFIGPAAAAANSARAPLQARRQMRRGVEEVGRRGPKMPRPPR